MDELVSAFGSQCVVVGVDSIRDGSVYTVRMLTGKPDGMRAPGRTTMEWVREVSTFGASLHAVVNESEGVAERLARTLEQAGIQGASLESASEAASNIASGVASASEPASNTRSEWSSASLATSKCATADWPRTRRSCTRCLRCPISGWRASDF